MHNLDEITQIFYEISMSIGMSLDINKMLRDVALVTLRKLNCVGFAVFMLQQDADQYCFERIFLTPRALSRSDEFSSLEQLLPRSFDSEQFKKFHHGLPLETALENGKYLHLMSLPGFGLLALFRAHGFLPQNVIHSFSSLNTKLSVSCQACLSHEKLEELLKVRTFELAEKKKAEEALRDSESRFRSLVENTSDWIWETNAQGAYTYASPAVQTILGHPPEFLLEKTPFDLMSPNEAKRVRALFETIIQEKKAFHGLMNTNLHKDGTERILETSGLPMLDNTGELLGFRGIDRDVTEIRKLQRDIEQSETTLRSIFRAAPTGIGMAVDRILTFVNNTFCEMLEYSQDDLLGTSTLKLYVSEEEFNRVGEEIYKQSIQTKPEIVETQFVKKSGQIINVLLSSTHLDPSDLSKGVTFTALDITDRKKIEDKLKYSERTYREIFNGSNDVIFIHDIDSGAILDANLKVKELYGYEPSELIGVSVQTLSKGESPFGMEEAAAWINKTLEVGPQVFEWMARNNRGEAFWVEVSLKKASIAGKDRLMAIVRDIRDRKAADEELRNHRDHLEELVDQRAAEIKLKNKELETFTYSVSHDLKAPLRGIDGYSRLLEEEYSDKLDEEGLFFLNNIRQGTAQMNKLIEDLLAYSRMERKELHLVSIDLNSLIENIIAQRAHDLEQNQINLTINLPFATVESDMETMRQVLANFIDNAIKYSKKDTAGMVSIGGSQSDDCWTLWVKDSGIGFDPKYIDRIFDIFQRLHRVEEYPGTGVGLAIVRKAVNRIGGTVRANSSPGKGSTFYLDIPKNQHVAAKENTISYESKQSS